MIVTLFMISGGLHANGCSLQGEYLKTIAIEYVDLELLWLIYICLMTLMTYKQTQFILLS